MPAVAVARPQTAVAATGQSEICVNSPVTAAGAVAEATAALESPSAESPCAETCRVGAAGGGGTPGIVTAIGREPALRRSPGASSGEMCAGSVIKNGDDLTPKKAKVNDVENDGCDYCV